MSSLTRLMDDIVQTPGWIVLSATDACWDPTGLPALPDDLAEFRSRCGGIRTPSGLIVGNDLRHAQTAILGQTYRDDRSFWWYVIAESERGTTSERIVIDLHPQRLGRCYEAFWDRFAVAGSMPIVAASFTEFARRLVNANGSAYWSVSAPDIGDAYD